MKRYLRALGMCFSMFCAIPMPFRCWEEDDRPLMTLFLPVVGLFTGGLWAAMGWGMWKLGLPGALRAAVMCAFPYLVTGFMHLDGFLDVTDAVKSWRALEKRREILKDPHVGSFAVAAAGILLILGFGAFSAMADTPRYLGLAAVSAVSRACAGLAVTALPPMPESQYAGGYQAGVRKGHIAYFCAAILLALMGGFLLDGWPGGIAAAAAAAGFAAALRRAFSSLKGMSGDIAGYAITVAELCGAAAYAVFGAGFAG